MGGGKQREEMEVGLQLGPTEAMGTRAYRESGLLPVVVCVQVFLQLQHAELQLVQKPTGKELKTRTICFRD